MFRVLVLALLLAVIGIPLMAYADPPEVDELSDLVPVYTAVSASGSGLRHVWMEDTVAFIGVHGETEFYLEIAESHPEDIDTCWVYFDGEVQTGTSIELIANSFRVHYGAVVIEFEDETFDYAGFAVCPAWGEGELEYCETLNISAPAASLPMGLPSEASSVFNDVADIDPGGSETVTNKQVCDNGYCIWKPADYQECTSDSQCKRD